MERNLYKILGFILAFIVLITCPHFVDASNSDNIHIISGSDKGSVNINFYGDLNIGEKKTIIVKVYDKAYVHKKTVEGKEKHFINFLVFHKNQTGWGKAIKNLPNHKFEGPGGFVEKTDLPLIKAGDEWIGEIKIDITRYIKSIQVWKYKNSGEKYYGMNINLDSYEQKLLKINAQADQGFYWDYYLYIPNNIFHNNLKYMLVEPNNTGTFTDDMRKHERSARRSAEGNLIAEKLGIPVLVPVFSRPKTIKGVSQKGWLYYTHALDSKTLSLNKGIYKRLDKQLLAMIEHAQSLLEDKGIKVKEKVFIFGFSASGSFANRFTALHPEKVQAAATGGLNGLPILPNNRKNNKKLYYPVGVYDLNKIIGKEFNYNEYKNTPQYLFMGDEDTNDTMPYPAPFNEKQKEIIKDIYNTRPIPVEEQKKKENGAIIVDRFNKAEEIYKNKEIPAQFVIYNGVGHKITEYMINDVVEFFKNNTGNKLNKISPN